MTVLRCARRCCWPLALLVLAACSNGRGSLDEEPSSPPAPPPPTGGAQEAFSVGGAISGLVGTGLVLQNNGAGNLAVAGDGPFTFIERVAPGAAYNVTVLTQPSSPAQTCAIANGSGSIAAANVTNVSVSCATGQFAVGGRVSGLMTNGLVLQNNAGEDLPISSNGTFVFPSKLVSGATYSVTVREQPAGQNCLVRNASGTIATTAVSNVEVACASNQFTIGGTITGLTGSGIVLRLNGGSDLGIVGNGPFAFETALTNGAAYTVSVRTQPRNPTQVCSVSNARGSVAGSNVSDIVVSCTSSSFSVGGRVSGLVGSGLRLQLNGGGDQVITSDGSFTFPSRITSGSEYRVTVSAQPSNPTQICTVASGSGTIANANVTSVRVTCAASTFSVRGTVVGLLGSGLVLTNNGGDSLTVTENGSFVFPSKLAGGSSYNVVVRTQPSGPNQACTVTNARGTVGNVDVSNVVVSCTTSDFTIGGTVLDLEGSGLVLRNNGGDELRIDSDGRFTFDTALPVGSTYNVTVAEQPRDPEQTCSVSNGSGAVGSSNVTNVTVRCASPPPTGRRFEVGGHVSELRGSGLILQNNGGDDLAIASNGSFEFATRLPTGGAYNVTILRQPTKPTQTCTVENGSGIIGESKIMNVEVTCRGGHH